MWLHIAMTGVPRCCQHDGYSKPNHLAPGGTAEDTNSKTAMVSVVSKLRYGLFELFFSLPTRRINNKSEKRERNREFQSCAVELKRQPSYR